jgi:NADH-quinone oxidoreductase subunit L
MTYPLMALAVGAVLAGFFGIPAAILPSGSAIEHFLEPSFTAAAHDGAVASRGEPSALAEPVVAEPAPAEPMATAAEAGEAAHEGEAHEMSRAGEFGLMGFSVLVAIAGILSARKLYLTSPEMSEALAQRFAGPHRVLSNKYYVDEFYDATVISGTKASGRGLWSFDRNVVDGVVNGASWVTLFSAWLSGLTDRQVVDRVVNLVGWTAEESSYWFRRLQTGLVQNYALMMLFGVAAVVGLYLIVR